jgi:hypothetical protein
MRECLMIFNWHLALELKSQGKDLIILAYKK